MTPLPPDSIMRQIAEVIPEDVRGDIVIIGSLAAGYHFFGDDPDAAVMTKDVDCLLSPNVRAVKNGRAVAPSLPALPIWSRRCASATTVSSCVGLSPRRISLARDVECWWKRPVLWKPRHAGRFAHETRRA